VFGPDSVQIFPGPECPSREEIEDAPFVIFRGPGDDDYGVRGWSIAVTTLVSVKRRMTTTRGAPGVGKAPTASIGNPLRLHRADHDSTGNRRRPIRA